MLAGALQANPYTIRNTDPLGIWRSAFEAELKKGKQNNRLIRGTSLEENMVFTSMSITKFVDKSNTVL